MSRKNRRAPFGRIFQREGRPGYYVRVRLKGREVVRYAGPDRKPADEFRGKLLRKVAREDLLGEKAIAEITFSEFKSTLLDHFRARNSPTTVAADEGRLKRIAEWFCSRALKDITPAELQDFLTSLRNEKKLSVATVNRYASLLSVSFKLAVQKGYARQNPLREVERPREATRAVPYISTTDVGRLMAEARDERFAAMIRILADTGMRRSEALALEWRDVDLQRGFLVVRQSKNRRPRQVELTAEAATTFTLLRTERDAVPMKGPDLVWPEWQEKGPQAVSSRFKTVAKRAGMPHLRLHDLRHAFCSRLAQAGVPLPTISVLAGHTSWLTTQRYASHVPDGATTAAIRSMDAAESADVKAKKRSS